MDKKSNDSDDKVVIDERSSFWKHPIDVGQIPHSNSPNSLIAASFTSSTFRDSYGYG